LPTAEKSRGFAGKVWLVPAAPIYHFPDIQRLTTMKKSGKAMGIFMDRIYDAAQQGLLACVTASEQEESLSCFLVRLRSDPAWSSRDVSLVEQEIRRLLSPGDRQSAPDVLPFRGREEPVTAARANGTGPGG
jgi:hypothetical protein